MPKKHMKKCLTFLTKKKMQIKNHIKIPIFSCENGDHQEHKQQQMLARMWGERSPHTLLVGM
jgi:isochorismate hydrolase